MKISSHAKRPTRAVVTVVVADDVTDEEAVLEADVVAVVVAELEADVLAVVVTDELAVVVAVVTLQFRNNPSR
jgi:hypothetical protein